MRKYKVNLLQDDTYQVVLIYNKDYAEEDCQEGEDEIVHQGSLADCEAYIRLKEGGYM